MKEIIFDIETTDLEADKGYVVAIGLKEIDKEEKILFLENLDERGLIKNFLNLIDNQTLLIGYNISKFDIPYIKSKCFLLQINCNILKRIQTLDLLDVAKANLKFSNLKLNTFKQFFEIEDFGGEEIKNLFMKFLSGDEESKEKIIEHLKKDLVSTEKIYKRLLEVGIL